MPRHWTISAIVVVFLLPLVACGTEPNASLETNGDTASQTTSAPESENTAMHGDTDGTSSATETDTQQDTFSQTSTETANSSASQEEPDTLAELCAALPPLPIEPTILMGFTDAEDFAFDDRGNAVSIDMHGNLVRVDKQGNTEVWLPVGSTYAAGTAFLPTGELIISDSFSTLYKIYPNGGIEPLLTGLNYPNGVAVDLSGTVYVSEHNAGRIREVDPETGEFRIIAQGLVHPNGLTFSPDYQTLYCGSFGAGVIYEVSRSNKGGWGPVSEFAHTPDAPMEYAVASCRGKAADEICLTKNGVGSCTEVKGRLRCIMPSPCKGAVGGESCQINGYPGTCTEWSPGVYECQPLDLCAGMAQGDACEIEGEPGQCVPGGWGLVCWPRSDCHDKAWGDSCEEFGYPGQCLDDGQGGLQCLPPDDCSDKQLNDNCFDWQIGAGRCVDSGVSGLVCQGTAYSSSGGLDGIGVDACGNVYVTEYILGKVWRFAPTGGDAELVFDTNKTEWIPNMKWGSGYGGFELDRLYVAERGHGYLFEVPLGVPGKAMPFPPVPSP